jgi:hypothetical protein
MRQKYNTDASFLRYYFLYKPKEDEFNEPPRRRDEPLI